MKTEELEKMLYLASMPKHRLASALGVSEPTLYRWLRVGLTYEQSEKAKKAIRDFAAEALAHE